MLNTKIGIRTELSPELKQVAKMDVVNAATTRMAEAISKYCVEHGLDIVDLELYVHVAPVPNANKKPDYEYSMPAPNTADNPLLPCNGWWMTHLPAR